MTWLGYSIPNVSDFKERHDIIQKHGWEFFCAWFLEFNFKNWWQLNGCTGVPIHKIYRTKAGSEKNWKDWTTHAPIQHPHPPNKCEECECSKCQVDLLSEHLNNITITANKNKRTNLHRTEDLVEVAEVDINVYYSSEEELDTDTDSEIEFLEKKKV